MIDEIQVENLALISKATLLPTGGLTVLTGETGAGKSALLSALKLLMGARGDKDTVREGQDSLEVSGRFFVAGSQGGEGAFEEGLIVKRRVSVEGRSRVYLDGAVASVGDLARVVAPTIDLCGQHEHQQLMKPAAHVAMLDAWAGSDVAFLRERYEEAYAVATAAFQELVRVRETGSESSAKLDEARYILQRIDAVDPLEGEYDSLLEDLGRAEHAETLALSANTTHEVLAGENGALDSLQAAIAALESGARFDATLSDQAGALREASYVLEDVAREALDYRDSVEFDPEVLAEQHERMASLQGLLRVYGPRMEDVLECRYRAADLVSLVDDAVERERVAQKALDQAECDLEQAAKNLSDARRAQAPRFAQEVSQQMGRLEMGEASLECSFEPLDRKAWTKVGSEAVEFVFRPGVGMQARPLVRIASGGEISRVMLAIKVVLGASDSVDTLVFDEVDAGVGGSAAVALAGVLADLATTHQVIVVTHLAQVAVRGETHYVVRKVEGEDGFPCTSLRCLDPEERPFEIARMLSGEATQTSLAHAREMLGA